MKKPPNKTLTDVVEFMAVVEEFLESPKGQELLDRKIEERFKELSIDETCIEMTRTMSDEDAKVEIESYLKDIKKRGIQQISLLDLIADLNLPGEQIERIMDGLKERGVKSIDQEDY